MVMGQKGYISEFVSGTRIVSHGKISDLSQGFRLPDNSPFSVYVRPKTQGTAVDALLRVRCYQDANVSDAPVAFYDWTPMMIAEIGPDDSILSECDIWWGSGSYVDSSDDGNMD